MYMYIKYALSREDYDALLESGCKNLPKDFYWTKCHCCGGERRQNYTVGCGLGTINLYGTCDWCKGSGLISVDSSRYFAAPESVITQVLNNAAAQLQVLRRDIKCEAIP